MNKYEGHTPGPYLREGTSVYALEDVPGAYRRGVPAQQNRIYFGVQGTAPQEEKEAVAALLQDAPELLRQRDEALAQLGAAQDVIASAKKVAATFLHERDEARAQLAAAKDALDAKVINHAALILIEQARAQRDALLTALERIEQLDDERVYDDVGNDMQRERFVVDSASAKRIAREAIAATKGGA